MICCFGPELHPKLTYTQSSLCLGVLKADRLQPAVPATDSSVAVSSHSWSQVFLSQKETDCSDCQPCSFWGFFRVKLLPLETVLFLLSGSILLLQVMFFCLPFLDPLAGAAAVSSPK